MKPQYSTNAKKIEELEQHLYDLNQVIFHLKDALEHDGASIEAQLLLIYSYSSISGEAVSEIIRLKDERNNLRNAYECNKKELISRIASVEERLEHLKKAGCNTLY